MATTPVYALPYQGLSDPPNGATLGQDLANKLETELTRIDNPPLAQLRQTVAQTLTNNAWTAINLQTEDIDTSNGHSTITNISRYTAPKAGKYELAGGVAYAGSAAGQRWSRWAKNGVDLPGSGANMDATAAGQALLVARTILVVLAAGDYIELQALQSSGGNLDTYVGVAYAQSTMTVRLISA